MAANTSKRQGGLGRGLDALLGDYQAATVTAKEEKRMQEVPIELLDANPAQPRKSFDEARLQELAGSLKKHGMVQPIVVRKENGRYLIITGERRYRAALMAEIAMVPIVERNYEDAQIHEIALIENIQREDLNPIEEAAAISFLMQQHDLTQEEVAERLSKSRPAVTNALRLLSLPETVKEMLREGELTAGHGRALSALSDQNLQIRLARQAVESKCSVRALEQIVTSSKESATGGAASAAASAAMGGEGDAFDGGEPSGKKTERPLDADLYEVESRLRERLGTKVKLTGGKRRGKITIEYFSPESLQEIYDVILGR